MWNKLVLTGAAGRLGGGLRASLAASCKELHLVDRVPVQPLHPVERSHQVDLSEAGALSGIVAGADAIVHFAGYPREADWDTLLAANVQGVLALWDAAREAGVGKIVYASSNHAVGFYLRTGRIGSDVAPRPDSRYGVTKVFMEAVAACYGEKYGVQGFGLRIGSCAPEPGDARALSHWIHPDDLAALVQVGLACDSAHEIVYGVSDNSRSWWDNSRAEALGYRPRHSADPFIERLQARTGPDPVGERFQGGSFAAAEYVVRGGKADL